MPTTKLKRKKMTDLSKVLIRNKTMAQEGMGGVVKFTVSAEALNAVLEWYNAFHAGDWYEVYIDDERVYLDHNGGIVDFEEVVG